MSRPKVLDDLLTTREVAEYYGIPMRSVHRMIREGRLVAHKVGWVYVIHRQDLPQTWPPPVI